MKFTIERKDLLKALTLAHSVVENRNTIPILANVMIVADQNNIHLTATDLDIQIKQSVSAEVAKKGGTTIHAGMLKDIVSKLSDGAQVEFEAHGEKHAERLSIKSGKSSFRLQSLPIEDFPDLSAGDVSHSFKLTAFTLHRLFDTTGFAVSQEETRYYLNGVYFHRMGNALRAVATDGHRLAMAWNDAEPGSDGMPGIIVPRKTVNLIRRHLEDVEGEADISLSTSKIILRYGKVEIISKLIDGTFPDYERVIPESNNKTVIIDVKALASVVDRLTTISTEKGRAIKFAFSSGKALLSANSPDTGSAEEDMEIDYDGPDVEVGFNSRYMLDVLANVDCKSMRLEIQDGGSPTVLLPGDGAQDYKFVLMPMRY
jgi:DNA polymerase-3 subunit beta